MFNSLYATASSSNVESLELLTDAVVDSERENSSSLSLSGRSNTAYGSVVYDENNIIDVSIGGEYYDNSLYGHYSLASASNATLDTIHEDIQLLNLTVILMYGVCFMFVLIQKWR